MNRDELSALSKPSIKTNDLDKPKYKRTPIILNDHTIAVLHIFSRYDKLSDLWMTDYIPKFIQDQNNYEESAQQFIEQFEDHYTPAFMQHLSILSTQKYLDWCKETKQLNYLDNHLAILNSDKLDINSMFEFTNYVSKFYWFNGIGYIKNNIPELEQEIKTIEELYIEYFKI